MSVNSVVAYLNPEVLNQQGGNAAPRGSQAGATGTGAPLDGYVVRGRTGLAPTLDASDPARQVQIGGQGATKKVTVKREVRFHNARAGPAPTLDVNGVEMAPLVSAVRDYHDDKEVRAVLYPEVEALCRRLTGAKHVACYGHLVRSEDPEAEGKLSGLGTFTHQYARFAHSDTSDPDFRTWCFPRLRGFLGLSEAECNPSVMDMAYVNVWKPRDYPVAQNPLAILDAASMKAQDAVPITYAGDSRGPMGLSQVLENPGHRWLWWPKQTPGEALVFKQMDMRPNVARFGFHTSFLDPTAATDAPGCRSIELWVLLGFPQTGGGGAGAAKL